MLFDLHVHTDISACSTLKAGDILTHARRRGLDGVCLTDHDTMSIRSQLREGPQDDGLVVIIGMEYETPDGDFLVFGPFEDLTPGLDADGLLDLVSWRGGAAVAAHPFRQGRSANTALAGKGLCGIFESLNGRNTTEENRRVADLADRYPLTLTGGSDAHTLDELGRFATWFEHSIRSRDDLVEALTKGLCRPQCNTAPSGFTSASVSLMA